MWKKSTGLNLATHAHTAMDRSVAAAHEAERAARQTRETMRVWGEVGEIVRDALWAALIFGVAVSVAKLGVAVLDMLRDD